MPRILLLSALLTLASLSHLAHGQVEKAGKSTARRIVLVAGETATKDVVGHHDYLAGCKCLEKLFAQTPGIATTFVRDGWPEDESVFEGAAAVVFYTDGGGKQAFLKTPERVARVQALADAGVGLVCIHQAVDFPAEFEAQAKTWLGGVYINGKSGRGHWPSAHVDFPEHPIARGVVPWKVNDGWLNGLQFVEGMTGVVPLVWSGKVYQGSRAGLEADIVGWAFERPRGGKPQPISEKSDYTGRSFSFTGLDAHSAWSLPGMRQLVVNGILWSAHAEIPSSGAPNAIDEKQLAEYLTPREGKPAK